MVKTKKTVSTHKPLNLNCSEMRKQDSKHKYVDSDANAEHTILFARFPKSLMCGSFNVQPTKENNYLLVVGDNYEKRR